nr:hypothetical transcript [Hymenolepis microstoma]
MHAGRRQVCARDYCHETNISHRRFIENSVDEQLYINLDQLPSDVPCLKLNADFTTFRQPHEAGIPIPLFIALPWMVLRTKICQEDSLERPKNFLESRSYTPINKPVPPAVGCFVCRAVHYLRFSCKSVQDAMSFLLPLKQEVIFAILREFNRRLRPKLFQISPNHLKQHARFSYIETALTDTGFQFPLEVEKRLPGELSWEAKRSSMDEWTNGFMYLIRRDIGDRGMHGHVGCFIWSYCLKILRCSLYKFLPGNRPGDFKNRAVYIDAIHAGYDVVVRHIKNMASAIVESAIELESGPEESQRAQCELRQHLLRACENFLTMNMPTCFKGAMEVPSYIIHYRDHAESPEQCLCRFYEKLKDESHESLDAML